MLKFTLGLICLAFSGILSKETLKRIKTAAELSGVKEDFNQLNCVLYYAPQYCNNCKEFQDAFTKAYAKVAKFSKFYMVNCESIDEPTETQFCTLSGRKILPKIACYNTPKYSVDPYIKKELPAEEKIYFGKENIESIVTFVKNSIPSFFMEIKNEHELKRYQKDKSFSAKLYLYTTSSLDKLPELKAISLFFKDRIGFARITSPKLIQSMGFSNIKSTFFLESNGERSKYEAELKSLTDLRDFIQPHALDQKIIPKFVDPDVISLSDNGVQDYISLVNKYTVENHEEIFEHDPFVLVHVHRPGKDAEYWMDIIQRFGKMVVYYDFEIENEADEKHANEKLEVKDFPILRLYKVGEHKSHPKITYKSTTDPDDLGKDLMDFIYDDSLHLQYSSSAEKLGRVMRMEKHAVIYFSENERISPAYKYVSNMKNFTKDMFFFHAIKPSREFMAGYGVPPDKRPAIVVMQLKNEITPFNNSQGGKSYSNDIDAHLYTGEMTYGGLREFLVPFLDTFNKTVIDHVLYEIESNAQLDVLCKRYHKLCLIFLLDGSRQDTGTFTSQLAIANETFKKFDNPKTKDLSVIWIDAKCHGYLLPRFDCKAKNMPVVLMYYPKSEKFTKMKKKLSVESVEAFVKPFLSGKLPKKSMDEELEIDVKNCKKFHNSQKHSDL